MVDALMNPNSTKSFCPNRPVRAACAPLGRIQPAMLNVERLFNSGLGTDMKLVVPLSVGALLSGSKPLNCGGRGPDVPRVALVYVAFRPAPEPIFAAVPPASSS